MKTRYDYDENLIPDPQDIEALVLSNADGEQFRVTEHAIENNDITTYTYDSGSGEGFDLIKAGETWLYLPFSEDGDAMILKSELRALVGETYTPYLEAFDFNLLDDQCGPGSVFIMDHSLDDDWWTPFAVDSSYSLAHNILREYQ